MKFQEELILTIIAGSREFIDQYRLNKVCNWIFAYKKIAYSDVKIISGTCRGADIMGENFAKTYNIPVRDFQLTGNCMAKMQEMSATDRWLSMHLQILQTMAC